MRIGIILLWVLTVQLVFGQAGQINIPRVEMMSPQPSPYELRDWRQVAIQFDSFVFDIQKTGEFLPFCFINPAGINYPEIETFRLHTYVGTNSPFGNEAINVLPALVGASLVGVDKRDQYGRDWIRMSRDFFNKANGELIYLNAAGARSGNDWWYDMMPNIYFYQLYDLYPDLDSEIDFQFTTIADRLAQAVQALGGSEVPWQPAYMNYRAFRFETMEPNPNGVPEPEAAGAFAWLLYHAYKETAEERYRKAAEWSIEFLNEWSTNPSYELMLPYGTLAAAKMNAELGTSYDVEKMVNWSFDRGFLRGWGTIVGSWGGRSVHGLIGEANSAGNDYAFQMNGAQQAAALLPMVRYDKRFSRAIARWMLHLANSTRLFYNSYLPADQQDASAWSAAHDPDNVIGYEAMRQVFQGKSPFATGDAVNGGWAETNLALYGTSSIGYLGSQINTTNVDMILQLDLLATDFYRDTAFPTYLYYNPYASPRNVQLQVGGVPVDVYESLSETFIHQDVTGIVPLNIPAGQAMLVTICPANGEIRYDRNRMLVNDVVVDFDQHAHAYTHAPRLKGLAAAEDPLEIGNSTSIVATVVDTDSEELTYTWSVDAGEITGQDTEVIYDAPNTAGNYTIQCIVTDPEGNADTASFILMVVEEINEAPIIDVIRKDIPYASPSGMMELSCIAADPDLDDLDYEWNVSGGSIAGSGATVTWNAPATDGIYTVTVKVTDDGNLSDEYQAELLVFTFSQDHSDLIAHYPMTGNADDVSGNGLHGQANGAQLTSDRYGQPQQAYTFNGGAQNIAVPNDPLLNVQDAISVAFWFQARELPDRESFIVSHGSWQNRWKVSITPDRKLRWTINSTSTIADLDAITPLVQDSFYHVVVTFGDGLMTLHINGQLERYKFLAGMIRTTTSPFLMGQMLPGETTYNLNGVIDDVKLWHGALSPEIVRSVYELETSSDLHEVKLDGSDLTVFPNPVDQIMTIRSLFGLGRLILMDIEGKIVAEAYAGDMSIYQWNLKTIHPGFYFLIIDNGGSRQVKQIIVQ